MRGDDSKYDLPVNMITVKEAQKLINSYARSFGVEELPIDHAFNRTLAENIYADRDYPPFNRSAMDGYALRSADFTGNKINEWEVIENLFAGNIAEKEIQQGQCTRIMTGAAVPATADAVIRKEDTRNDPSNDIIAVNIATVKLWQNISRQGEDVRKGECLLRKQQLINAPAIGVLAVTGRDKVKVYKLPAVGIVSTGNELAAINEPLMPCRIRDSNSHTLKAFFKQYHINDAIALLLKDDKKQLKEGIGKLLHKDILFLTGGVSKGDADYVPEVLSALGVKEIFHRVRIKPGNPLWFGVGPSGTVVFGLPGNPVSVQVAFKIFIEPFLRQCFGMKPIAPCYFPLASAKNKRTNFDEFFPCQLITEKNTTSLLPVAFNGSGDITAMLHADGIASHPAGEEMMDAGSAAAFFKI